MSFLNGTLLALAYTANMMATLPEKTDLKNISVAQNITTTTLSPEEVENKFDLDDRKCQLRKLCFYFQNNSLHLIVKVKIFRKRNGSTERRIRQ